MDMGFRAPVRPPEIEAGNEMREIVKKCPNLHLGLTALTTCQPAYLMSTIWTGGPDRVVFGSNAPSGIPLFAVKGIKMGEARSQGGSPDLQGEPEEDLPAGLRCRGEMP